MVSRKKDLVTLEERKVRDEKLAAQAKLMLKDCHARQDVWRLILERFLELLEAERLRRLPHRPAGNSLGSAVEDLIQLRRSKAGKSSILKLTTEARRQVAKERRMSMDAVAQAHRRYLANQKKQLGRFLKPLW